MIDLTSACQRTAGVVTKVGDDQLAAATPCKNFRLSELIAHIGLLALAFDAAAKKDLGVLTDTSPPEIAQLDADWRTRYPVALAGLAAAWQDPGAWQGMTRAGGVDLPGEVAGLVALSEVVIHGWDVARASGHTYDVDEDVAGVVLAHVRSFATDGSVEGLFGPAVEIADSAPTFARALALSGRDPAWRA